MDSLPQAAAFKRLFVSAIRRDTQGEDNHDIRIHFVGRPGAGRALRKAQGCYRHRCVERNWPRDGEETHRKGLSRGCELPEDYVRYDAPQHSRSETCGRRHWYRGNGQICRAYRNSEFWDGNADEPSRILLCVATRGGANASPEIRTRRQRLHVVGKPAYREFPEALQT